MAMCPKEARVGIVEDMDSVLEDAREALGEAGHTIILEAKNLTSAIKQLENLEEAPDVFLIDGSFPEAEGEEEDEDSGPYFASLVREKYGEKTCIVMFSTRKSDVFGDEQFPGNGKRKSMKVIEEELGKFVTNLP
jgi:DNA-binding NarL/FixJ family response regulator